MEQRELEERIEQLLLNTRLRVNNQLWFYRKGEGDWRRWKVRLDYDPQRTYAGLICVDLGVCVSRQLSLINCESAGDLRYYTSEHPLTGSGWGSYGWPDPRSLWGEKLLGLLLEFLEAVAKGIER